MMTVARIFTSRRWRALVALLVVASGGRAWGTVHDARDAAKMTEKMKTVCVGRFLIDLPDEARI